MGGAAVVFRHARALAQRGHRVSILGPRVQGGAWSAARYGLVVVRDALHRVTGASPFEAGDVEVMEPWNLDGECLGPFDAVIATGHQTVEPVVQHSGTKGFYFIQGDERALSKSAGETWNAPLARITVSEWLRQLLERRGIRVAGVVPNAIDPAEFGLDAPLEGRPKRIVALYHRHPVKGPSVLIDALKRIKRKLPECQATLVAARPPSHRLPRWVSVEVRPTQKRLRQLCNASSVCLHTSQREGWGLFPMEAAACGAAVTSTASLGTREYLTDGSSMLEVPVGDVGALVARSVELLLDDERRINLARHALEDVGRFSWERSTDVLEDVLITQLHLG